MHFTKPKYLYILRSNIDLKRKLRHFFGPKADEMKIRGSTDFFQYIVIAFFILIHKTNDYI